MRKLFLTTTLFFMFCKLFASLDSSLVVYLPFNGDANDTSGNGNHGIVSEAVLTTDFFGNLNSAYYFDGGNDFIQVVNDGSLDPTTNFTVCAMINPETTGYYTGIVNNVWDNNADESGYGLVYDNTNSMFTIARTEESSVLWGSSCYAPVVENEWAYFVGTYDGSQVKIYKDGNFVASASISGNVLNTFQHDIWIGRYYDSNEQYYFTGKIDEVRIYNRTLSDVEVSDLYDFYFTLPNIPSNISVIYESSEPELTWDQVDNATSYTIYSSEDPNALFPDNWGQITGVTETTWIDTNLTANKKFYKVSAVNQAKE